jgi:hypothetical protein
VRDFLALFFLHGITLYEAQGSRLKGFDFFRIHKVIWFFDESTL